MFSITIARIINGSVIQKDGEKLRKVEKERNLNETGKEDVETSMFFSEGDGNQLQEINCRNIDCC